MGTLEYKSPGLYLNTDNGENEAGGKQGYANLL
jgi:hypothetical protein